MREVTKGRKDARKIIEEGVAQECCCSFAKAVSLLETNVVMNGSAMIFAWMFGCTSPSKDTTFSSGTLDVPTYNIHTPASLRVTTRLVACIDRLPLGDFDLVGIQEDWMDEYHSILVEGAGLPYVDRFDAPLDDEKVYGAGLFWEHISSRHGIFIMNRVLGCWITLRTACFKGLAICISVWKE